MIDLLLRAARITDDGELVDIAIDASKILEIGAWFGGEAAQTWNLEGRVVLPGLVDAHTHLDKTYSPTRNRSGTLLEAIEVWRQIKTQRSQAEIEAAVLRALQTAIGHGVTAMRSHVDMADQGDLATLETILGVRQELRDRIDLQIVALGEPGGSPARFALMEAALTLGADLVGGAPALTTDPQHDIDVAFALAQRFGKGLDLHIDETEDPTSLTLEYVAEQTLRYAMQGQVTAGHCCSLAFVDEATAERVIEKVARAQLHIITLPSCNLVLMGRGQQPTPRGITRVKQLLQQGINVCAASDNVQDPFNPFGSYDPLQAAMLNAHLAHMTGEDELYASIKMVTAYPAQALGLTEYGLVPGAPADFVVLDTYRVLDAVLNPPPRFATFKAGRSSKK